MSLFWDKFGLSISYADISTGDIYVTQIENQNNLFDLIIDEIEKIQPSEILFSNNLKDSTDFLNKVKIKNNILFTFVENPKSIEEAKNRIEELFDDKIDNISTYLNNKKYSILNISILFNYIFRFQKEKLPHLKKINQHRSGGQCGGYLGVGDLRPDRSGARGRPSPPASEHGGDGGARARRRGLVGADHPAGQGPATARPMIVARRLDRASKIGRASCRERV